MSIQPLVTHWSNKMSNNLQWDIVILFKAVDFFLEGPTYSIKYPQIGSVGVMKGSMLLQSLQRMKALSPSRHLILRVLFFLRGTSFWTWRARAPRPRDCRDSAMKRCVGETHSITSSLALPPCGEDGEGRGDSRLKMLSSNGKGIKKILYILSGIFTAE